MISSRSGASAARSRASISSATTPISTLSSRTGPLYPGCRQRQARDRPISTEPPPRRTGARLHGRIENAATPCEHPGCPNPGEFRAPRSNRAPGSEAGWHYFCLDHVRAFNARYNFFDGLTPDEIYEAQSPLAGWERATNGKAFTFGDAHDLFPKDRPQPAPRRWAGFGDAQALGALGLTDIATADDVRRAYKKLVRRYHPDSNAGDRTQEGKLQAVVNAYTHLKSATAFTES